jgi:glycine/D-amino acid oxidase-like deaminating enzyme
MKLTSYWLDTSEPFRSATAGPVPGHCDVAVIGGGLTGCSAALALAKKGASVVLLEAETIGHAASGRNGGMCNNGFAQDYGTMSAKLGKDVANRLYGAFDAGVDTVERMVAEEKIDCSIARVGKIKLAAKPEPSTSSRAGRNCWRPPSTPTRRWSAAPTWPARSARTAFTAGSCSARAPACMSGASCAGWPKRRRGAAWRCTSARR